MYSCTTVFIQFSSVAQLCPTLCNPLLGSVLVWADIRNIALAGWFHNKPLNLYFSQTWKLETPRSGWWHFQCLVIATSGFIHCQWRAK